MTVVCLSVAMSMLDPGRIRMLQLHSQQCLNASVLKLSSRFLKEGTLSLHLLCTLLANNAFLLGEDWMPSWICTVVKVCSCSAYHRIHALSGPYHQKCSQLLATIKRNTLIAASSLLQLKNFWSANPQCSFMQALQTSTSNGMLQESVCGGGGKGQLFFSKMALTPYGLIRHVASLSCCGCSSAW